MEDDEIFLHTLVDEFIREAPELKRNPPGFIQAGAGFENFLAGAISYSGWDGKKKSPFALAFRAQPELDEVLASGDLSGLELVPEPASLGRIQETFEALAAEIVNKKKVLWPGFAQFTVMRVPFPRPRTTVMVEPQAEAVEYVNRALMAHYPLFGAAKPSTKRRVSKPAKKTTARKAPTKKTTARASGGRGRAQSPAGASRTRRRG